MNIPICAQQKVLIPLPVVHTKFLIHLVTWLSQHLVEGRSTHIFTPKK